MAPSGFFRGVLVSLSVLAFRAAPSRRAMGSTWRLSCGTLKRAAKDGKGTLLSSCRCRMPCKRSIALFHCRTFSPHVAHKLVEEQAGNVWKGMERSCCGSNVSSNCVPLLLPPSISLIFWTRSCPGIIGISWNTPGPVMAQ